MGVSARDELIGHLRRVSQVANVADGLRVISHPFSLFNLP
jgi:hypothetical protein